MNMDPNNFHIIPYIYYIIESTFINLAVKCKPMATVTERKNMVSCVKLSITL